MYHAVYSLLYWRLSLSVMFRIHPHFYMWYVVHSHCPVVFHGVNIMQFIHPFKDWWTFGSFLLFVTMNKAAVNMPCLFFGELTSAYLSGVFLGMEALGSRGSMRWVLFDTAQRFPHMVQQCMLQEHMSVDAHPCQQLVLSVSSVLVVLACKLHTHTISCTYVLHQ